MNAYGNTLDASETWPVLEYYRDIYCVKGVVTANSDTSLYSTTGAGIGWVSIDGNSYNAGESNAAELLGHRVEAYIQRDKSYEDTVLYVVDISDNELVIDADLVESVSDDCRTLEYYQNNIKIKSKTLTSTTTINYAKIDTDELIKIDEGNGQLIKNGKVNINDLEEAYKQNGFNCKKEG